MSLNALFIFTRLTRQEPKRPEGSEGRPFSWSDVEYGEVRFRAARVNHNHTQRWIFCGGVSSAIGARDNSKRTELSSLEEAWAGLIRVSGGRAMGIWLMAIVAIWEKQLHTGRDSTNREQHDKACGARI